MPPTQPGNHDTCTKPHRRRYSNPHNVNALHRRSPSGPRFPPPSLLGRLPPERVAIFLSGRHPKSLNDNARWSPAELSTVWTRKGPLAQGSAGLAVGGAHLAVATGVDHLVDEFGVARQDAPVDRASSGDDLAVAAQ